MARPVDVELHLDAYAALGCAVIAQAILDSRRPGSLGAAARAFVAGDDFALWAELLGLDASGLRVRIARAQRPL